MVDRIGVRTYAVNVTPVSGPALRKLLARADLMEREIKHLQLAIKHIRIAAQQPQTTTGSPLASAVMDSRNWMLSVVMSHAYIQFMLGKNAGGNAVPYFLAMLATRAVNAGADDAEKDRSA